MASFTAGDERQSPKTKIQAFALIRDKDGNPKIDGDPKTLPAPILALLTAAERRNLGVE